jgi:hypothetical protein
MSVDEAAEDVGEIGLGIEGVELCRVSISEAITPPVDAALIGAGEQRGPQGLLSPEAEPVAGVVQGRERDPDAGAPA